MTHICDHQTDQLSASECTPSQAAAVYCHSPAATTHGVSISCFDGTYQEWPPYFVMIALF